MEAVTFVGLQAAGKSTFYLRRFFRTHVRINREISNIRHRHLAIYLTFRLGGLAITT